MFVLYVFVLMCSPLPPHPRGAHSSYSLYRFDNLVWPAQNSDTEELTPEAHSDYVGDTFANAGPLNTTKILHAFRPAAAVELSLHG